MVWIIFQKDLELVSIKIKIQYEIKQHQNDIAIFFEFKVRTAFVISYQTSMQSTRFVLLFK